MSTGHPLSRAELLIELAKTAQGFWEGYTNSEYKDERRESAEISISALRAAHRILSDDEKTPDTETGA